MDLCHRELWIAAVLAIAGCSSDSSPAPDDDGADAKCLLDAAGSCSGSDPGCCEQDLTRTDLAIDLEQRTARATVELARSNHRSVVLEIGDLDIAAVSIDSEPAEFEAEGGRLIVSSGGRPTSQWGAGKTLALDIDYAFKVHSNFDGFLDAEQSMMSFTWPEFCGNLFPCSSQPRDGLTFTIDVTGVPEGQTAIFPAAIDFDAPSYMAAFTVGNYTFQSLGTTTAGTEVGVWSLPDGAEQAATATADLTAAFDFLEQTIGPYKFGSKVASVAVDWGAGDFGGMEHHPFWHVGRGSMGKEPTHHHEAVHGWFGNGVRLRCREDFILSEGVTTYLEARVTEAVGTQTQQQVWDRIQAKLEGAIKKRDFVVYPDGCNKIASLTEIFSGLPYAKGALYLRQVEQRIGRDELDAAVSSFYIARVGTAASMSELIAHIEQESGADLADLTQAWLKSTGVPCTLLHGDCVDTQN